MFEFGKMYESRHPNAIKFILTGASAGIPGVEVVAGPMGSGGGYIHAALWAVKEARGFSADDLLRGLFIAAGIGAIAYSRTEPTGERTGCMARPVFVGPWPPWNLI